MSRGERRVHVGHVQHGYDIAAPPYEYKPDEVKRETVAFVGRQGASWVREREHTDGKREAGKWIKGE